ncbi:glycosyltransferase family 2 protein [Streptomyces sp. NPDC002078]
MNGSVAVVVPTRNRPSYLPALFTSLEEQELRPARVIVVDSSEGESAVETRESLTALSIPSDYVHTPIASAPAQRNIGVDVLRRGREPTYIAFIDDDVRPAPDYLSRLAGVLESDTVAAIAGASGVSDWKRDEATQRRRVFLRLFQLDGDTAGRLLPSGANIPVPSDTSGPMLVDWLFGCALWRTSVFDHHRFRNDMPGGALYDDVEFSARVGRSHGLVVDPQARLVHLLADEGRADMRLHYHRWMRNRHAVVQAVFGTRRASAAYWWSSIGAAMMVGRHVVGSADYRQRFAGLLSGAVSVLRQEPMR